MNCGNCKHFWAKQEVCRRNPPQGLMSITPAKLAGAPPIRAALSFYPPVNQEMVCGEHEEISDADSITTD